jgi:hypothetical protein
VGALGAATTRPGPTGGTNSDSNGIDNKHTAAAIHTKRRAEADARRIANAAR